jgi:hypothetical protein
LQCLQVCLKISTMLLDLCLLDRPFLSTKGLFIQKLSGRVGYRCKRTLPTKGRKFQYFQNRNTI